MKILQRQERTDYASRPSSVPLQVLILVLRASTPTAFSNTDTSKLQAQLQEAVSDTSAPSVQERGVTSPQASQRD